MSLDIALLVLEDKQLKELCNNYQETGMGFYVCELADGNLISVLNDGTVLPLYKFTGFYGLDELLKGEEIPDNRQSKHLQINNVFKDTPSALIALQAAQISPQYTGNAGAIPLIVSHKLPVDTVFYRCCRSATDHNQQGGNLKIGTYLTTQLDYPYANTGLAAVGRYALPIPLPACYVFQYELPAGITIRVGTVAPAFGQAGGGVEICLTKDEKVKSMGMFVLPIY